MEHFIRERSLQDRVKLPGYVPDEDLISLYNGAAGYVMISLYEGFGLPALEAMRCGLAGIVADNSSLPEVTGESAILVAPEDETAIEKALATLARDAVLRQRLASEALARSKKFSIRNTAGRMLEIFRKECGS